MMQTLGTTTAAAAQQSCRTNSRLCEMIRRTSTGRMCVIWKHHGQGHEKGHARKVQRLRKLAVDWRGTGDDAAFQEMASVARVLGVRELHEVAQAFSTFWPSPMLPSPRTGCGDWRRWSRVEGIEGTLGAILDVDKASGDDIMKAIANQNIEIVLTAHPTSAPQVCFWQNTSV